MWECGDACPEVVEPVETPKGGNMEMGKFENLQMPALSLPKGEDLEI
jgi:hypothetical protein